MFEHLTPFSSARRKKQQVSLIAHLGVFLAAVLAIVLLFNMYQGPLAEADRPASFGATVAVSSEDTRVAAALPQVEVFRFVINASRAGIALQKLKIYVNGLYDSRLFDHLKLYQNGSQLGFIESYDAAGNIYFNLDSYALAPGPNEFYFLLNSNQAVQAGDIIQFSFGGPFSIVLNYQGQIFSPRASYPLSGGSIAFTDQSRIVAYNILPQTNLLALSDEPLTIAHLQLSVPEEKVDLQKLVLSYDTAERPDLATANFQLYDQDRLLASSGADQGQIVFELAKPIVFGADQHQNFVVKALGLPSGQYSFTVTAAVARAYATGQEVGLDRNLFLSAADVRPYYLELTEAATDNSLTAGWNEIFAMTAQAHGDQVLQINRLSWSLQEQDLSLSALELWVNDKSYLTKLQLEQGLLVIDLALPIRVSKPVTSIKLLAKVRQLGQKASIQSYLLNDTAASAIKNSHLLWSADNKFYTGYQLPDLPLAPVILTP